MNEVKNVTLESNPNGIFEKKLKNRKKYLKGFYEWRQDVLDKIGHV